jgi:hypothetical protein
MMKKIMEVYEADNGIVLKRLYNEYHLFVGETKNESIENVVIANTKDAFNFLCQFFCNKLKVDRMETFQQSDFDKKIIYKLRLEDE